LLNLRDNRHFSKYFNKYDKLHVPLDELRQVMEEIPQEVKNLVNHVMDRLIFPEGTELEHLVPAEPIVGDGNGPIVPDIKVGDRVVLHCGRLGKILSINPDGTLVVDVEMLNLGDMEGSILEDLDALISDESPYWKNIVSMENERSKRLKIAALRRICQIWYIDNRDIGLRLIFRRRDHVLDDTTLLGYARIRNEYELSIPGSQVLREYLTEFPGVANMMERWRPGEKPCLLDMFENESDADILVQWVLDRIEPWELGYMTETFSGDVFGLVEELAQKIDVLGSTQMPVKREEILRPAQRISPSFPFDMGRAYISLDPASFGAVGFVVGFNSKTRHVAFIQGTRGPRCCRFGGFLREEVGSIIMADWLVPC
jgi:hypothetical protein